MFVSVCVYVSVSACMSAGVHMRVCLYGCSSVCAYAYMSRMWVCGSVGRYVCGGMLVWLSVSMRFGGPEYKRLWVSVCMYGNVCVAVPVQEYDCMCVAVCVCMHVFMFVWCL